MKGTHMLRTLLAAILALAVSAAGAQIVNRPVAAGSISNPGTSLPATCAVGYLYFKSNSTAGQNLHLCTAANTWTQMTGGNLPATTTGTGNVVLSDSATLSGTIAGNLTWSGTHIYSNTAVSIVANAASTSQKFIEFASTGNTGAYFGIESSAAGGFFSGSNAYETVIYSPSNVVLIKTNGLRSTGPLTLTTGASANQIRMAQTTVPTCSSNCGTSPSVAGTDTAGVVTMGASGVPASAWVVTFNGTWATAPSCIVQPALATMVVGKMPIAVVTSTTTMTVTTNGTAPATSDKYQYVCIGVS